MDATQTGRIKVHRAGFELVEDWEKEAQAMLQQLGAASTGKGPAEEKPSQYNPLNDMCFGPCSTRGVVDMTTCKWK